MNPLARSSSKARDVAPAWREDGSVATPGFTRANVRNQLQSDEDPGCIMVGRKMSYGAGLGAGEALRAHANDLEQVVADPKGAAHHFRIRPKRRRPIVVREHRVGMLRRASIVVFREQPPHRGLQAEEREHPAGNVLHGRLFPSPGPIRRSGRVRSAIGDSDQLGLAFHRGAHLSGTRILQLSYTAGLPSGPALANKAYNSSGSDTGSGRSSSASISRKAEVHAPIARASERMAAAEVTFLFLSCRQPKMASARSESSHGDQAESRLSSRRS